MGRANGSERGIKDEVGVDVGIIWNDEEWAGGR